mmetsp:Transcript_74505/g.212437  ORF Transcript_74505/g.212437 Transcript_74505/m.212437 type:complete len:129 (+) Transcript_74505:36-422(+)
MWNPPPAPPLGRRARHAAAGGAAGGMPGMAEDEIKLAMQYRDKMQKRLEAMTHESTSGGVTAKYDGQGSPLEVVVSEGALAGGPAKVGESVIQALKDARMESQKGMQATMMEMQKELMAELQASAPKE